MLSGESEPTRLPTAGLMNGESSAIFSHPVGGPFSRERKGQVWLHGDSPHFSGPPSRVSATWLPSAQSTLGHKQTEFRAERTKNRKWEIRHGDVHQASRRQDSQASLAASHSLCPIPGVSLPAQALFIACWSQWQIF